MSFSCLTSVLGQFVFNSFSDYKFPFDKWALLDLANAASNTLCYGMASTMSAEDLMNPQTKEIQNYINVVAVLITWFRFFSYLLVIESTSILILTLIQMMVKAMTFIGLTVAYIILMIPVF